MFGRCHDIAASERTELDLRGEAAQTSLAPLWLGGADPLSPFSVPFGLLTQPFEFPSRPADEIDIDPLEGRAQLRPIELAVVVDPAFDVLIVLFGQILQGFVAVMVKRPTPDGPANGR